MAQALQVNVSGAHHKALDTTGPMPSVAHSLVVPNMLLWHGSQYAALARLPTCCSGKASNLLASKRHQQPVTALQGIQIRPLHRLPQPPAPARPQTAKFLVFLFSNVYFWSYIGTTPTYGN